MKKYRFLFARFAALLAASELFSFVCGSNIYTKTKDMIFFGIFLCFLSILFTLLFGNLAIGSAICIIPSCIITLISYYKIKITGLAFYYSDLSLWTKLGSIVGLNRDSIKPTKISLFIVLEALTILVILYFIDKKLPKEKLPLKFKGAYAVLFILVFAVIQPFSPREGSLLSLWTNFVSRDNSLNIAFDIDDIIENAHLEEDAPNDRPGEKPNVIVILSESFFDVTGLNGVSYEKDPVSDYHSLSEEGISGRFFSPTMGYGTSNIEMEILTGISTRAIGRDQYFSEWSPERFKNNDSVPKLFKNAGYRTVFMHSFNDSVYNRTKNYKALGFDELVFSDGFKDLLFPELDELAKEQGRDETELYYEWLDEKYLASEFFSDRLIGDGIKALVEDTEEPVFIFATTMENHTPYQGDKYSSYDYAFDADLNEDEKGVLNSVTQGIADSSAMLGELCSYLKTLSEPSVVIFFGDHKPNLPVSGDSTLYSSLGIADPGVYGWDLEEIENMYSTDYLIWANDSAYLLGKEGEEKDVSSTFIGLDILNFGGIEYSKMWQLLAAERKVYTAWTWYYFIDAEGKISANEKDTGDKNIIQNTLYVNYYFRREFGGN